MASSGIIIKTDVIRELRSIGFMDGRLFHKSFDGKYGEEDSFLGTILFTKGKIVEYSKFTVSGNMPSDDQINRDRKLELKQSFLTRISLERRLGLSGSSILPK